MVSEIDFPIGITQACKLLDVHIMQITRLIDIGFVSPTRNISRRNQSAYLFSETEYLLLQRVFLLGRQGLVPKKAIERILEEENATTKSLEIAEAIEVILLNPSELSLNILIEAIASLANSEHEQDAIRNTLLRIIVRHS
jgi:DNA-binding transcriptional MerR regulator